MIRRVIIIHGYLSHPDEAWLPWLKRELERRGCVVALPAMPRPNHPEIHEWKQFVAEVMGEPDATIALVGHSLGCHAVLRYLEDLGAAGKSIAKTLLVAGTFPMNRSDSEALAASGGDAVLVPWFSTGVNAEKVKAAAGQCTLILSDNDPYIDTTEAAATFRRALDPEIVIVPGAGHFNEDDNLSELPEALGALFPRENAAGVARL